MLEPLYIPDDEPMGIVAFFSGGGSSFKAVYESSLNDSHYKIVAAVTDTPNCDAAHFALDHKIPLVAHDIKKFYEVRGKKMRDMEVRRDFDYWTVDELEEKAEKLKFRMNVIMLSGYMKIITSPIVEHWPDRILNVHPANLMKLNEKGMRKYTGDNAVYDAIKAGERETCSTIHLVNDLPDQGAIVLQSDYLPIEGLTDEIRNNDNLLHEFAKQHQNRMKTECDIPAFKKAIKLFSLGCVHMNEKNIVRITR